MEALSNMSWAMVSLTIVFALNLILFLFAEPEVNSPMLGLLKGIFTGEFEQIHWSEIFTASKFIQMGVITVLVLGVSTLLSPSTLVTGSFSTVHALTVIGIAMFTTFMIIPNVFLKLPYPIGYVVGVVFGFMTIMSVMGFMKGGE